MKNGSITEQLKTKDKQLADGRENKQENIQIPDFESEFANSQNFKLEDFQTVNQENKQNFNLPGLGLSSALGLFTPDISNQEKEQAPVKKKKPKRGFSQS